MTAERTTFVDSIADGFRGWRDFSGRTSRPQFWYWTLFTVLLNMVLSTIDAFLFPAPNLDIPVDPLLLSTQDYLALLDATNHQIALSVATWAELILLVPTLAVTARRFRDGGMPAWLGVAVRLIPYLAVAVILPLGYSIAPLVNTASDSSIGLLLGASAAFLVCGLGSLAALVVTLVGGLRPSRPGA